MAASAALDENAYVNRSLNAITKERNRKNYGKDSPMTGHHHLVVDNILFRR